MKLHLGCWHRYIPGFIHIDLCDLPHIDYKTSVDRLTMIEDNSVELIYCSHVFEYFDPTYAPTVLTEWHRVLKNGGILRLSVPDFGQLIKIYETSKDIRKILGPLFGRMEVDKGNEKELIFHKVVYDEVSLKALLQSAGFDKVEKWDWRQTEHSMIDDHSQAYYPHMEKETGIQVSLNIQAQKK